MRGEVLIFMLFGCFACSWKAKGTTTVSDEHLLAVGNNEDGDGIVTVASKLASSVTTVTLNGHSISSACGTHPSRCRELMVQSTRLSDLITKHLIMIPLENGLQLLEFCHDGAENELNVTSQHSLMFSGISGPGNGNNCSSLNAYQIGTTYYVPCITRERLYVCTLTLNTTAIVQSSVHSCQQMLNIGTAGFISLSNIVLSDDTYVPQQHLLFLLQNGLYNLFPITDDVTYVGDFSRLCSRIDQLLLSPKGDGELLLYCRDRTSIVYSTDVDQIVNFGRLENVQYPCSPSAEFIIHLNQNQMELSYKLRNNGSDTVQISPSPTISSDFHSGICFNNGGHNLFAYTDQSMGVYLFNATSRNSTLLPNTCCCGTVNECEFILVYNDQYLVVRNREENRITVHDIRQGRAIIVLQERPFLLLSLIHDIQIVHVPTEPITTSMDTMNTSPSEFMEDSNQSLSPGIVAAIVVISIIIITAIIVLLVVIISIKFKRVRQRNYSPTRVQGSADAAVQGNYMGSSEPAELNATSLNEVESAVNSDDETIQPSVTPASAATNHGNLDDTEKVEPDVVPESDIKTEHFHTEDTEIASKQTVEADVHAKVDDEASGTSNTQFSKSDVSSNTESVKSNTIDLATADKDRDESSDTDSQRSQSSSGVPKTVQQRIKESSSVDSQVAVPEEKTDCLYPLRTHFMQENSSRGDTDH